MEFREEYPKIPWEESPIQPLEKFAKKSPGETSDRNSREIYKELLEESPKEFLPNSQKNFME